MKVTLYQKKMGVVINKATGLVVDLNTNQSIKSGLAYIRLIKDSDLTVANIVILQHNFNYHPKSCVVYDSNGEVIYPDNQGNLTTNIYFVDLTSYRPLIDYFEVILDG